MEAHHIKCVAQKVRRIAEAKEKEEEKKRRIVEEKKKKLEYIQQLWDKVLVENITLLEGTKDSQVAGTKYRENTSENEDRQ